MVDLTSPTYYNQERYKVYESMKNNKNELDLTYQLNGNWVCHTMPYPDDDSLNTVTCTSWLPWDFRDWEYPSLYRFEKQ